MINEKITAPMPKAIFVELTDKCNLRCSMCRSANFKGDILPLETFRSIAEEIFPTAEVIDLRGWGESTILKNLKEYLDIAKAYPAKLKLITNATVKRPELWKMLSTSGVIMGVSFDAADKKTFAALRGNASIDTVIANMKLMAEGYRSAGYDPKDYLYLCITASGANLDQLEQITTIGREVGIRRFKIEPLKVDDSDPDHLKQHRKRIPEVIASLTELSRKHDLLIELSAALSPDEIVTEATKKLCIHPWEYLYINARGRLGFCDHLNGREEFTFAQWSPGNFEEFWNGDTMRQLRQQHLTKFYHDKAIKLCVDCNWCYSNRYMDLEDWVNPEWDQFRVNL